MPIGFDMGVSGQWTDAIARRDRRAITGEPRARAQGRVGDRTARRDGSATIAGPATS
jgi:hypothetical protein